MHLNTQPTDESVPMIFIADRLSVDIGQPKGRWLALEVGPDVLRTLVNTGGVQPPETVIIDQIGLGPIMIDEDADPFELLCNINPLLGLWQDYR